MDTSFDRETPATQDGLEETGRPRAGRASRARRLLVLATAASTLAAGLGAGPASAAGCDAVGQLFGGCRQAPPPEPPPPAQPSPAPAQPERAPHQDGPGGGDATRVVPHLLDLMNRERAGAGLAPFQLREDVSAISRDHSLNMAGRSEIWHNDGYFTASVRTRLAATGMGENVAMNGDLDDAHRRLMESPHHRDNLMNPRFTVVGLGVALDGRGFYYVTQNFVQPKPGAKPPRAGRARAGTKRRPAAKRPAVRRAPRAAPRR